VRESTWFALRAVGNKVNETGMTTPWYLEPRHLQFQCNFGCGASMFERATFVGAGRSRPAAAHTGAIWVSVAGVPAAPPAELVRRTLERLDALEAKLTDERLDDLVVYRPFKSELLVDGVPKEGLLRDRQRLRVLIESARARYQAMLPASSGRGR
jgi:hypothetical protein